MGAAARRIHKLTAEQAIAMAEAGILDEDARVELLGGVLVDMSPQGLPHAGTLSILTPLLTFRYAREEVTVRCQLPLHAGAFDLPEPDLAVVHGVARTWLRRHPTGPEALLVIEVADSSTTRDREKAFLYARAKVPVYWIIDLNAKQVIVYSQLDRDGYQQVETFGLDAHLPLPGLDQTLAVADVLG